jgi:hypothetical protein
MQTFSDSGRVVEGRRFKSFDLLQGERVGRDEVRENGVVQAVDDSSDDHETVVAEPKLRQNRRQENPG